MTTGRSGQRAAALLLATVLGACTRGSGDDASAPPGTSTTVEPAAPAGAPAETMPAASAALDGTWLDGTWIAGGRDRFHLVIAVDGAHATVSGLDGAVRWSGTFEAEQVVGTYHRLRDSEGRFELHVFVRGPDELAGIVFGENGLAEARRVGPLPRDLLGEWVVGFSDNYHLAGGTAVFEPQAWSVRIGDRDARAGQAYGLGERDGAVELALRTSPDYLELATFLPTPGDTWLAWVRGTDQHMVLHREGQRPVWIPTPAPRVPAPGAE